MKNLLEKLSIIALKYEKLYEKDQFNIFQILRPSHDEVNLHSRFIFELLNPKGTHNLGNKFAKLFIDEVDVKDFDLEGYEVYKEYKQIDVLLRNVGKKQAIIIENKIYAEDQYKQIERYYETLLDEGYKEIHIIYLTLYGADPTEQSIGNLDATDIIKISYQNNINNWIEKCIEVASKYPSLRETFIQYQKLINNLTGGNINQMEMKEIIEVLAENEQNILKAQLIGKNWTNIQKNIEWMFWEALEDKFKGYGVLNIEKYSKGLDPFYKNKQSKHQHCGLVIKLYEIGGYSLCIRFERFTKVSYGIVLAKDGRIGGDFREEFIKKEENKKFVESLLNIENIENKDSSWYLGLRYLNPEISFYTWDDETLKLINYSYRKTKVEEIWQEVKEYLGEVNRIYENIYNQPSI
jgi:hypothetical protein